MGDAGVPTPVLVSGQHDTETADWQSTHETREINVLVTGFGPFKSFTTNPSYLIARALPTSIDPSSHQKLLQKEHAHTAQRPVAPPKLGPYKINIYAYPTPLRVAYGEISTFTPHLYDYVLHIGMAGGRDNYTLETIAHRDHYKIKDIDDRDGFMAGEYIWKQENLPEQFEVGWHKEEVLARWTKLTDRAEDEYEESQIKSMDLNSEGQPGASGDEETRRKHHSIAMIGKGRRAVVKLSKEAGRFLCEFILYTSLSTRWKEARDAYTDGGSSSATQDNTHPLSPSNFAVSSAPQSASLHREDEPPAARIGKTAFLHVPGATGEHDIARGARVAEAAILALVSSWEEGYRNSDVYNKA